MYYHQNVNTTVVTSTTMLLLRWATIHGYMTSHQGQLSLLSSTEWQNEYRPMWGKQCTKHTIRYIYVQSGESKEKEVVDKGTNESEIEKLVSELG